MKSILVLILLSLLSLSPVNANQLHNNLFSHHLAINKQKDANKLATTQKILADTTHAPAGIINENTALDLSFLGSNHTQHAKDVFSQIDKTKTNAGAICLQKLLTSPTTSITLLKQRQAYIKQLYEEQVYNQVGQLLQQLAQQEEAIIKLWQKAEKATQEFLSLPFFNSLTSLNENALALETKYLSTKYLVPLVAIASPVIISMLTSLTFKSIRLALPERQQRGLDYEFGSPNIFTSYWELIRVLKIVFIDSWNEEVICWPLESWNRFIAFRPSFISNTTKALLIGLCTYYYLKFVGQNISHASQLNKAYQTIAEHLNQISEYCTTTNKLHQLIKEHNIDLANIQKPLLCINSSNAITPHGHTLAAFQQINNHKNYLISSLEFVGTVDAYYSLATLYKQNQNNEGNFCFAEFTEFSDTPQLKATHLWHPLLNSTNVITNDLKLEHTTKNSIITGPNAGGKSTVLKSVALAAMLAQTVGLAPARSLQLTPFALIRSHLNVPDYEGHESLFQAEMNRACELLQEAEEIQQQPCLFIFDELFTGTNPKEGISGAYAILATLGAMNNTLILATTHFDKLTELAKEQVHPFTNFKVSVQEKPDGSLVFPYKLTSGISHQAIALKLLKNTNINKKIIDKAYQVFEAVTSK